MSNHTPGPWTIATGADGSTLVTSPHDRNGIDDDVCLVYGGNDSDSEAMSANARLIAAAPKTKRQRDELLSLLDNLCGKDAMYEWTCFAQPKDGDACDTKMAGKCIWCCARETLFKSREEA